MDVWNQKTSTVYGLSIQPTFLKLISYSIHYNYCFMHGEYSFYIKGLK